MAERKHRCTDTLTHIAHTCRIDHSAHCVLPGLPSPGRLHSTAQHSTHLDRYSFWHVARSLPVLRARMAA